MIRRQTSSGFSIIEVLVVLGIMVMTVAVIGQSLVAISRVVDTSTTTNEATAYVQESMELVGALKNIFFGCKCGVVPCSTCSTGGQSCSVIAPYTSCWFPDPVGQSTGQTRFRLQNSGGAWSLVALSSGTYETISANPFFSREIVITTLSRNASNDIVSTGGTADPNTKQVTVTVRWTSRGQVKQVSDSAIFTRWENL